MKRTTRLYIAILTGLCLGIGMVVHLGNRLPGPDAAKAHARVALGAATAADPGDSILSGLQ